MVYMMPQSPDDSPPVCASDMFRERPHALAAMAIFFLVSEFSADLAFIESIIFSHTRGTAKKKVGRDCCSSGSRPPERASGVAK